MHAPATPLRNQLLAALPPPDFERLYARLELIWMPLGEVLHEVGEDWRYVYFPTTAIVSLLYVLEDGESAEVAMIGNDGMIGISLFMGGEAMPNRAVVRSAGYAYRLHGAVLKAEFERVGGRRSGALNRLLLGYTQALVGQMAQGMFSLLGILDNIYEGIVTINGAGIVCAFNKAAEAIFGYGASEVIGRNVCMLMPDPYRSEHDGYLGRYLDGGAARVIGKGRKVSGLRKSGEEFPLHLSVTELHQPSIVLERLFIGLVRDVSLEDAAQQRIEFQARHDPLTGLFNRASLGERLVQACAEAPVHPCALLFVDLDHFKPINDTLGHDAGDLALVAVARRIRNALDEHDYVGRLGGDEFVALLLGIDDLAGIVTVAGRLLRSIGEPIRLLDQDCRLGASIGVALIPRHGDTPSAILAAADRAMYAAKRAGRNQIVICADAGPDVAPLAPAGQ